MNRALGKGVLYHAVSSYQLLEAMLHRRLFHREERAALLLRDVRYVIEAHFDMTSQAAPGDNPASFRTLSSAASKRGNSTTSCFAAVSPRLLSAGCEELPPA